LLAWAVIAVLVAGAAVGTAWRLGAVWPLFVGAGLFAVLGAPAALARWRLRRDFFALRQARRRVAADYDSPTELRAMVGTTPAAPASLQRVVHARCEAADRDGVTLLIEVEEGDEMERAWRDEGFEEVEQVETSWGRIGLLVRRPRPS
jgi:hypothetical protein